MGDLSQRLWNVRSRLMDYKIEVCWVPGKQQMAAGALGRNPVWHGTAENNQEREEDSGYQVACFIADNYRQERVFEEEFDDPMLEELFDAAKEDQAYQKVVAEVKKGLTKEALKLLHSDHPARPFISSGMRLASWRGARTVCWSSRDPGSWCLGLQGRR